MAGYWIVGFFVACFAAVIIASRRYREQLEPPPKDVGPLPPLSLDSLKMAERQRQHRIQSYTPPRPVAPQPWGEDDIQIEYVSGAGERTRRLITVRNAFVRNDGAFYLQAWCHMRQEPRQFRLDRIEYFFDRQGQQHEPVKWLKERYTGDADPSDVMFLDTAYSRYGKASFEPNADTLPAFRDERKSLERKFGYSFAGITHQQAAFLLRVENYMTGVSLPLESLSAESRRKKTVALNLLLSDESFKPLMDKWIGWKGDKWEYPPPLKSTTLLYKKVEAAIRKAA
ncbi:MAG: WYL domain-containing protein [Geminicoccaceae bacterium]